VLEVKHILTTSSARDNRRLSLYRSSHLDNVCAEMKAGSSESRKSKCEAVLDLRHDRDDWAGVKRVLTVASKITISEPDVGREATNATPGVYEYPKRSGYHTRHQVPRLGFASGTEQVVPSVPEH